MLNRYEDPDARFQISELTDIELALAYEDLMMGLETWPSYLIIDEIQFRGFSFVDMENLLIHQYN